MAPILIMMLSSTISPLRPEWKAASDLLLPAAFASTLLSIFALPLSNRKYGIEKMADGTFDLRAERIAQLLLDNGIDDLRKFDAATEWADGLISSKQGILSHFAGAGTITVSFLLGVIADSLSGALPVETKLQTALSISLLVFAFTISRILTAPFYLIDNFMSTPLKSLQDFRNDVLGSKIAFIDLLRCRDLIEPEACAERGPTSD